MGRAGVGINLMFARPPQDAGEFADVGMRVVFLIVALVWSGPAYADLRIARDFGGYVEEYKAKYEKVRDRKERVIIDGICNSACTLVLGIVPLNRICATPRASLGFHQAYYDKKWTAGLRVTSVSGTDELMSYYPPAVKQWIARKGGLSAQMKRVFNGAELWEIIDPCPDEQATTGSN
jgi:hypothetical protein